MREGDVITIEATELVAGGDAIARVDGFPIFASNVYPGDVARVRLYEVKKGFAKADLVDLVTPSPFRRAAPCPVAGECGGCDWTALRLDKQLEAKHRILTESLRRIGKLDPASLPEIRTHPSPLNYRLRSRLHSEGTSVGFYAMRSNRVVPLAPECEVVGIETARVITSVARDLGGRGTGTAPQDAGLSPLPPGSLAHARDDKTHDIWEIDGQIVREEREVSIGVNGFTFRLDTRAFFQVNRHLLGTMLRLVEQHASRVTRRRTAIDLYAGVGFFTLPIARHFEQVIAVEGASGSARYARMNATLNGKGNVKVIDAPVEHQITRLDAADFVFLDPPRAGARREVIDTIGERTKETIAYLSCDPVTFSRDASRLIASGWRLSTLDLLDLFPNTHHVETLSSFERAP